jgi:hypothetical protein
MPKPSAPLLRMNPDIEPMPGDDAAFELFCREARTDLQWAGIVAALDDDHGDREGWEATLNYLVEALIDRTAMTDRLWHANLIPRDVPRHGEGPKSVEPDLDAWLLERIETLRHQHPLYEAWAQLNDARLVIAHRLPPPAGPQVCEAPKACSDLGFSVQLGQTARVPRHG